MGLVRHALDEPDGPRAGQQSRRLLVHLGPTASEPGEGLLPSTESCCLEDIISLYKGMFIDLDSSASNDALS